MVETPNYLILGRYNNAELRQYKNLILVTAMKNKEDTYSVFSLLAKYIFGGNVEGKKIKMTAPVLTSNIRKNNKKMFSMSFIMPKKYKIETLPKPLKNNVIFEEKKIMKLLVLRFSGNLSDKIKSEKIRELNKILKENKFVPKKIFIMQYNPPWTISFLRRNEVAAEI
ncbi:MAG: heme-binding protein [Candidatus Micrarchaeaceae archaeon]